MANRYAIIEDGIVANIALADDDFAVEQGWIEAPAEVGIGWLYDGDFTAPETPTASVPISVTRRQAKRALLAAGLLDEADAAIAGAGAEAQIDWADALEFRRDNPLIAAIGSVLELSEEAIDDLFRQAATYA